MRKRNRQILLWLTEKELEKLNKKVEKSGTTRQEYFLHMIQEYPVIECPKPDLTEIRRLIADDGAEINELAHTINAEGVLNYDKYAHAVNRLYEHMNVAESLIKKEIDRRDSIREGTRTDEEKR